MIRDFGLLLAVGIAVICLVQHHRPARRPRHPRVQVARPRAATSARAPSAASSCGSAALPAKVAPVLIVASLVIFVGGILVEDKLDAPDRPDPVGQPGLAGHQGPRRPRGRDRLARASSASSSSADDVFSDETVDFVDALRQRRSSPSYPDELLTASSIVTTVSFLMRDPGRGRRRRPPARRCRPPSTVAPDDIQLSTVNADKGALNLIFRTGGSGARGAGRGRATRSATPIDPPDGVPATPSGLAVVGRRPAREPRGQPHPAHLPGDPLRVPLPRRAAPQPRPVAAVAGAGAHRRRRRVAGGLRAST